MISIHVPLAGNDDKRFTLLRIHAISIHVPLAGNDLSRERFEAAESLFQSTFPLRGTTNTGNIVEAYIYISIHVPLAGNDGQQVLTDLQRIISIHVPLAGNDNAPLGRGA